jgi:hypothetical protein
MLSKIFSIVLFTILGAIGLLFIISCLVEPWRDGDTVPFVIGVAFTILSFYRLFEEIEPFFKARQRTKRLRKKKEIANPKGTKAQNDFVNEIGSTIQPPLKQTKKQEDIKEAIKILDEMIQKTENERKSRILTKPPYIVQDAMKLFFREHEGSRSSSTTFGVEESPLACFGYRVGKTSGRPVAQRREILNYAIWGEIPDFFTVHYRNSWGKPGTYKRYNKILNHLNMLVEKRADRKTFETAISHWTMDISWLKKNNGNLMNKLRRINH